MKDNFIPYFKENKEEKFVFINNEWVKTNEETISNCWNSWVVSEKADRYLDKEGFLVFGFIKE